ncbi:MAG: YihY/virulence factor BrkB family protein [Verrucomicrobiales bacterium]
MNVAVGYGGTAALIAAIYRFMPEFRLPWREVVPGALLTTLLFNAGKFALVWYLAQISTSSAYGATGSFAAFLIWAYYSGRIFFFGAEFTLAYSHRFGRNVR